MIQIATMPTKGVRFGTDGAAERQGKLGVFWLFDVGRAVLMRSWPDSWAGPSSSGCPTVSASIAGYCCVGSYNS